VVNFLTDIITIAKASFITISFWKNPRQCQEQFIIIKKLSIADVLSFASAHQPLLVQENGTSALP
jgi:hypothetical protein